MHPRLLVTTTVAALLMAGLAWAPPAAAWGRSGYRFGSPPPPFSAVIPFGSPYDPRALGVPRSPWAPPAGYRFYGTFPYSPGFYPRSPSYLDWERPFYRERERDCH